MPATNVDIDVPLVTRLIAAQFPQWANLPIRPVQPGGWDNRTFHLGDDMSVRLPSAEWYSDQVAKEQRWLPWLASLLPLPIPVPLAMGVPGEGYPWQWSVYRWVVGEPTTVNRIADLEDYAGTLAQFLTALYRVDPVDGPPPGQHNFWRGGPLTVYDAEARRAIAALAGVIDSGAATEVWEAAMAAPWPGPTVWFHGDIAAGNLLLRDGRLAAVIDFGTSGVGDPSCDLTITWTLLSGRSRDVFREALPFGSATWARGRGWTLWKAMIVLAAHARTNAYPPEEARRVIAAVLEDHRRAG